jgi:hypothetical protein
MIQTWSGRYPYTRQATIWAIPPLDSQEVPQPDSHEVPLPEFEDIPHPEDLALLVLKENEVWTIGMFGRIYLCMFMSNLNTIYFY